MTFLVIPGERSEARDPESMAFEIERGAVALQECRRLWVPDSRYRGFRDDAASGRAAGGAFGFPPEAHQREKPIGLDHPPLDEAHAGVPLRPFMQARERKIGP